MNKPKEDARYSWTAHVFEKMQHYGISESRIKRIIRFPKRREVGIVPSTVAVMQPADSKKYQELWVMYKLAKPTTNTKKLETEKQNIQWESFKPSSAKIRVITTWRYPGKSPERDPVPEEVIREIQTLL